MYILGLDIGGTKCAAVTAEYTKGEITLLKRKSCATRLSLKPEEMIEELLTAADKILEKTPDAIGISCGGPLDIEKGLIMSPPNLPGWDNVNIVKQVENHYKVTPKMQNDANASAIAEWKFGAGKGTKNMIFLTFGTGLGAGLILNGRLYNGTNGNAGEAGHIRLASSGPVGYGKQGSFEGFCSGAGIARLGYMKALEKAEASSEYPLYFKEAMTLSDISAAAIAEAADKGDETALEVYRISGEYLGRGLSVLIDILNPEVIVIGSVFTRSRHLLWESAEKILKRETLPESLRCCRIVPCALGEAIGDYAAIATALEE